MPVGGRVSLSVCLASRASNAKKLVWPRRHKGTKSYMDKATVVRFNSLKRQETTSCLGALMAILLFCNEVCSFILESS